MYKGKNHFLNFIGGHVGGGGGKTMKNQIWKKIKNLAFQPTKNQNPKNKKEKKLNYFLKYIGRAGGGGGGGQTMQQHIWKNIQNRCIPHTKRQDLKN